MNYRKVLFDLNLTDEIFALEQSEMGSFRLCAGKSIPFRE